MAWSSALIDMGKLCCMSGQPARRIGVLNAAARRAGFDVIKHQPLGASYPRHRQALLELLGVNVVIDVGANIGQTGHAFRERGYSGLIVSFEPVQAVFEELREAATHDAGWICVRAALGDYDGEA